MLSSDMVFVVPAGAVLSVTTATTSYRAPALAGTTRAGYAKSERVGNAARAGRQRAGRAGLCARQRHGTRRA